MDLETVPEALEMTKTYSVSEIRELLDRPASNPHDCSKGCGAFFASAKPIIEQLLKERDAYRYVAIQNSYQGVDISDDSVCKLVDEEARRIMETKER